MKAAIDLLSRYSEPRILVIGDMAELGENGEEFHQEIGVYAQQSGINNLFTCGELTRFSQLGFIEGKTNRKIANKPFVRKQNADHFSQQSDLIIKLKKEANAGTTILVKGSRSAKMENVVRALVKSSDELLPSDKIHASLEEAQ
jgi:UDP-N-acetylmuramoyl-tripeptide--D-alanyl-D-alanine ligase